MKYKIADTLDWLAILAVLIFVGILAAHMLRTEKQQEKEAVCYEEYNRGKSDAFDQIYKILEAKEPPK